MLQDDPPPGTAIETSDRALDLGTLQRIPAQSRATLGKRLTGEYGSPHPDDLFEVMIGGQTYYLPRRSLTVAT
jgi:hypothetical protein